MRKRRGKTAQRHRDECTRLRLPGDGLFNGTEVTEPLWSTTGGEQERDPTVARVLTGKVWSSCNCIWSRVYTGSPKSIALEQIWLLKGGNIIRTVHRRVGWTRSHAARLHLSSLSALCWWEILIRGEAALVNQPSWVMLHRGQRRGVVLNVTL